MKLVRLIFIAFAFCVVCASALAQSWTPLVNQPTFGAGVPLLLTDGTLMVHDAGTQNWWRFTPDVNGSYLNGTWSALPPMPTGHAPLYFASAVLKDGRVIVIGGEYINFSATWSNLCSVYNPVTNSWSSFSPPTGWTNIGDVQCTVMPDGKLFLAALDSRTAMLDPSVMTWTAVGTGKLDNNNEEGWVLLPDGTILTVCCFSPNNAEKYIPWTGQWVTAGSTPTTLPDAGSAEIGPGVLMFDGRVFWTGATGHNAVYTPPATPTDPGTWAAAPDFPLNGLGQQLDIADGPACLLPNGKVLCATSPGIFNSGLALFEYNGITLAPAPNVPNGPFDPSYVCNMIMLPNGQMMMTDFSSDVEIYTPTGGPLNAWRPTIATCAATVNAGVAYPITGTQFNGLSQTSQYGDDATNATNYPIVRIRNNASGHVSYCRTFNHSTMAVATGSAVVSTTFLVPGAAEGGASTIEVVANGIPSATRAITVVPAFVQSVAIAPASIPGGTSATGTITLTGPAPTGGLVVNLSSNNAAAAVPATATVPAGATTQTFTVTTANVSYVPANATITQSYGSEPNHTANLTVNPSNYAQFIGQTVPASMVAGQSYAVTVQFKNNGGVTWDTAHQYRLRSMNPANNSVWGLSRLALLNGPIAPGATATFGATVIAPSATGTYNFSWQCIQDNIGVSFGPASANVAVSVAVAADAARFVSQSGVPATINAGTDFSPSIVFKNVGTNTWTSANTYLLRSRSPYNNTNWGTASVALPASVAPNTNVTFVPIFTAPITPGSYGFEWSMMRASTANLFGDLPAAVYVNVVQGPNNAQYINQSGIPLSVGPGVSFTGSMIMKNLGTATWDSTYKLVSRGPFLNTNWGTSNIPIVGTVAPNANYTFTQNFTAPVTPGTYTFRWRMAQGAGNVAFGQETLGLSIVVSADAAQYISRTGAVSVNAGQDFYAQYTMKNTGTTTWTSGANYSLRTITPTDNLTWAKNRGYVPGSVAPGGSVLVTVLLTAPITPGTYTQQWQMNHTATLFGEKTPLLTMTVAQGADNAQFVTQTGVPTTVVHGTTFNATITMKNLGTATWGGTYSLVPIGSNNFGIIGIASGSVAPNANGTFNAIFTAPATPGTYTFQWRMSHGAPKFGQASTSVTITVT